MYFYQHTVQEILDHFNVNPKEGLGELDVTQKLQTIGTNELPQPHSDTDFEIISRQFKNPLIPVLILAGIFSFFVQEYIDALVIIFTVFVNVIVGFIQEYKAQNAITALRQLTKPFVVVLRKGIRISIESKNLVPGDILILEEGMQVQADARIIMQYNLGTNESILTGESQNITKTDIKIDGTVVINDQANMVFAGTMVVRGRGKAVVTTTGKQTEIGAIADVVSNTPVVVTPLQKSLTKVSQWLLILVGIIAVIVFILGINNGNSFFEMILFAVSLSVSILPEGLLIGVTVALAIGTTRMAKRNAVVRTLPAVETLGEVTVVAADKTGTLTHNRLSVMHVFANNITLAGNDPVPIESHFWAKMINAACLVNNASENGEDYIGDPLEIALLQWVEQKGIDYDLIRNQYHKVSELPFSTDYRLMATLMKNQETQNKYIFMKGAPDQVIERCEYELIEERIIHLTDEVREDYFTEVREMAMIGLKPLVLAYHENIISEEQLSLSLLPTDFVILGIIGFADVLREDAKDAIAKVKQAGVRVLMLTGDHRLTASAIARMVGINNPDLVLKGEDIDGLSDAILKDKVQNVNVYARVTPKHKLRIVKLLQELGEIVAMTGDGINDAPALSQANIGVAMGQGGTDVAKEASDMVLLDNNFNTIKAAIEEGRAIFDNIKSMLVYLLSTNVSEVIIMMTSLLLKLPLPLYPTQILWHNLITDGLPNTALVFEPADPGVMARLPRQPNRFILDRIDIIRVIFLGLTMSVTGLLVFYWYLQNTNIAYARTATLIYLGFSQLLNAYSVHAGSQTIFKTKIFDNHLLTFGIISAAILQLIVVKVPIMQSIFRTVDLNIKDWIILVTLSLSIIIINELWHLIRFIIHKFDRTNGNITKLIS